MTTIFAVLVLCFMLCASLLKWRPAKFFLIPGLCLGLCACTSDQVTTSLELAVDAMIAAAPAVEIAANVPPATQTAIANYLAFTETCLASAQSVLANKTATVATIAAQIAASCSADELKSPVLPAGTPQNVVTAVNAVSSALGTFLGNIPKASSSLYAGGPTVSSFFGTAPVATKVKPDRKRLDRIKTKLDALHAKLHPVKK